MMSCEMKSNDVEIYAMQEVRSAVCQGQKRKCSAFSQDDVIGLAVVTAFLAAATNAAVSGYHEFFFLMVVPILFSALVGFLVKKMFVKLAEEGPGIAAFLHRIYAQTIAAPFQKL